MKRFPYFLLLALAPVCWSQQPEVSLSDHELVLQLMHRIQDLEAEVQRLKQPGQTTAAPIAAEVPTHPAATPATSSALQQAQPVQLTSVVDPGHDMQVAGIDNMHFQGFSDIQYHASRRKGDTNTFRLGQFNLFITNRLSDKFSILGEVVLEAGSGNEVGVDLERLLFQYSANDYFKVSAGRYHTAIGYYNTAFHHATWLQTAVDRPFLFAFEDGGGILPIHNVGLSATGRIPSGGLGLHYIAEIGNGRTSRSVLDEPVQNHVDENNGKSLNVGLYARPDAVPGLQAGFSYYRDTLHPEGIAKINQTIFASHLVYQMSGTEFLTELLLLRHVQERGPAYHIPGFYSQVAKRFGRIQPYFRYEYLNVPAGQPLFADVGLRHGPTAGMRFNFSDFAAYKFEYFRDIRRRESSNGLRTQVSFTF